MGGTPERPQTRPCAWTRQTGWVTMHGNHDQEKTVQLRNYLEYMLYIQYRLEIMIAKTEYHKTHILQKYPLAISHTWSTNRQYCKASFQK